MTDEKIQVDGFEGWLRANERKQNQQARRFVPQSAADLLGPGYGPRAIRILDWNSDEASFSGQFWSPTGSLNSPDGAQEWLGLSISEVDNFTGVQIAYSVADEVPTPYRRRWTSPDAGQTRSYDAWVGNVTPAGVAVASPFISSPDQPLRLGVVSDWVVWQGQVETNDPTHSVQLPTSGAFTVVNAGVIPLKYRPMVPRSFTVQTSGSLTPKAVVSTDGTITIAPDSTMGYYVNLGSLTWPIRGT